jgi:hypothetical protein
MFIIGFKIPNFLNYFLKNFDIIFVKEIKNTSCINHYINTLKDFHLSRQH